MCHVLIIEDDWLIADHIAQIVEMAGAESVDMAESEEDAVATARANRPSVIFSDVNLREGTGFGAVSRIVAEIGSLPVVFVTGEPRGFEPPSPDMLVLHKPVSDRIMREAFARMLERPDYTA